MFNKIFKARWYPALFQWLAILGFVPIVGYLLFGPDEKDNIANLLVWLIWWPMLCVLFMVAGRVWCGVCPFSRVSDLAQQKAGLQWAPPEFIKTYGGWMILIAFLFLSWMEEASGIVESPRKTAVMLLAIMTGAIALGLFFRGRVWCRYVCPLGGIGLVYARAALLKIRAAESACSDCITKECMVPDAHYAGCPMNLVPFDMETVAACNLCGACIKRCSNNALSLKAEFPSRDMSLQSAMAPVVVWLVIFLAGLITFLNGADSHGLPLLGWLEASRYPVFFRTLALAAALSASWALFHAAARKAARGIGPEWRASSVALGILPMIPLLLFSHLGHVGHELLEDGGELLAPLAAVLNAPWLRLDFLWEAEWTEFFSPACIAAGLALSCYTLYWAGRRATFLPARARLFYFGLYYALFALLNGMAAWPVEEGAETHEAVEPVVSAVSSPDGWPLLWPFVGIICALVALVLIIRRTQGREPVRASEMQFTRTWNFRISQPGVQVELLSWLVDHALQSNLPAAPAIALANAGEEVIHFLQRKLPPDAEITMNIMLRKGKGLLIIYHSGHPLSLPEYRKISEATPLDDTELDGLELRLASSQVDALTYHARLSDQRCNFTLRKTFQPS